MHPTAELTAGQKQALHPTTEFFYRYAPEALMLAYYAQKRTAIRRIQGQHYNPEQCMPNIRN
jgi:hypothetical protein